MDIELVDGGTKIKAYCDHCGNLTFQNLNSTKVVPTSDGKHATYLLCHCTICDGITLIRFPDDWNAPVRRSVPGQANEGESEEELVFEQLWPIPLGLSQETPELIRNIYNEARLIKRHSPSAFVVQIGRALEAVMHDKEAEGRSLYKKIDWLVENEHLPSLFGEQAHLNRIIRNWGAHATEISVEAEDVEVVDEFLKRLLNTFMWLRQKLSVSKNYLRDAG